jgi:hypothetical protein
MTLHVTCCRSPFDDTGAHETPPEPGAASTHDAMVAALALELRSELQELKAGKPGACRRFEDAALRSVAHLRDQGMSAERVLARIKQMIYGHVPWEPFRDPSHIDRLAVPIITACIASCYADRA